MADEDDELKAYGVETEAPRLIKEDGFSEDGVELIQAERRVDRGTAEEIIW